MSSKSAPDEHSNISKLNNCILELRSNCVSYQDTIHRLEANLKTNLSLYESEKHELEAQLADAKTKIDAATYESVLLREELSTLQQLSVAKPSNIENVGLKIELTCLHDRIAELELERAELELFKIDMMEQLDSLKAVNLDFKTNNGMLIESCALLKKRVRQLESIHIIQKF